MFNKFNKFNKFFLGLFWIFNIDRITKTIEENLDEINENIESSLEDYDIDDDQTNIINGKLLEINLDSIKMIIDQTGPRSISRRILLWVIVILFIFLMLLAAVGYVFKATWAVSIFELAKFMYSSVLAVVTYYFVNHASNSIVDKFKQKNNV